MVDSRESWDSSFSSRLFTFENEASFTSSTQSAFGGGPLRRVLLVALSVARQMSFLGGKTNGGTGSAEWNQYQNSPESMNSRVE